MDNNLVTMLIGQHNILKKELTTVSSLLSGGLEESTFTEIDKMFKKFTEDLLEHLVLENDTFYPDLLKKMKEVGQDTNDTEKFIEEMIGIGKVVEGFLGKYGSSESIKSQINDLKKELPDIIGALVLRIESEEAGVFEFWKTLSE
ncbi:hemerythrin domain-containing protein [Patescibacteria group bacterium]